VLKEAPAERFDAVLVLGDLVGYGASPNEVVEVIRSLPGRVYRVRGNHDRVASGLDSGIGFNRMAFGAAQWTAEVLTAVNLEYVRTLPRGPVSIDDGVEICHGSPLDEDGYLIRPNDVVDVFLRYPARLVFFGHTHLGGYFVDRGSEIEAQFIDGETYRMTIRNDERYLVNPGSVGQPRDGDPRASFMIYDSDSEIVEWRRIEYPVATARQKILDAGLDRSLGDRLEVGV